MNDKRAELSKLVEEVVCRAVAQGADAAEAVVQAGAELQVKIRKGAPELIHEAASKGLGLRVFKDGCAAVSSTSDFSAEALRTFVDDTVTLCRLSEPDELNSLPERSELWPLGKPFPDLCLFDEDASSVSTADALDQAKRAEAASLAYSDKVTNTDGATYSRTVGAGALASADKQGLAFIGSSRGTYQSLVVEPICDDRDGKKRNGHYWTADRFVSRMLTPEEVGREAARRTVRKLAPEKLPTAELPVVFDPDAGRAIVRLFVSVISGGAIYRKSSYLLDREGTQVASPLVTFVDDPLIERGPGSRVYDGEGLPARRNLVVEEGVLRTFLCDTYSARKLGRKSTGNAGRGLGGSPYVTTSNFLMLPGKNAVPKEQLIAGIKRGFYVTEMMGFGFNAVTGDFSRGAGGFLIEDGELKGAVSEVTISANFDDLLKRIDAVGTDVDRRSSTMNPSFRVSSMTIAGR